MGRDRSVHSTVSALSAAAKENSPVPAAQSNTRAPLGTSPATRAAAAAFTVRLLRSAKS